MGRQLSFDGCCLGMAVCSLNLAEVENCLFPWGSFPGCLEAAGSPQLQDPRQKQCPSLAAPGGPFLALLCTTGAPSPRADVPAVVAPLVCGCWYRPAPCSQEPCRLAASGPAGAWPGSLRTDRSSGLSAPPTGVPRPGTHSAALSPGVLTTSRSSLRVGSPRVLSRLVPRRRLGKWSICVFREILTVSYIQ